MNETILFLAVVLSLTMPADPSSKWNVTTACIGENATLPSITKVKCTDPRYKLKTPTGKTLTQSNGKFVRNGPKWSVRNVQPEDEGKYVQYRYCNEGQWSSRPTLLVICKNLTVYAGSEVKLPFPKPPGAKNATRVKLVVIARFKNGLHVLLDANITEDAIAIFGQMLTVGPEGHTLIFKEFKKEYEGNYSSKWSWEKEHHKTSKKFIYRVNVLQMTTPMPSTTQQPTSHNISSTTRGLPTGKQQSRGTRDTGGWSWMIAVILTTVFMVCSE